MPLLESGAAMGKAATMSSPVLASSAVETTEKTAIQKISIKQLYIFLWKLTIATILLVLPFVVLAAVIDMVKSR
jgi:heme/copper-type cytochrome/quinol oxidase subunit 1